jgi:SEC-C motif domain protein
LSLGNSFLFQEGLVMTLCPCGSGTEFDACCGPILSGAPASGPEALMRSRYTAFARKDVAYLEATLAPEAKTDFNREEAAAWANESEWQGLDIRSAGLDESDATRGTVEFVARYRYRGKIIAHHELGSFRLADGHWFYVDGVMNPKTAPRTVEKVGRNDPCPCGSGKKYKKCCGA